MSISTSARSLFVLALLPQLAVAQGVTGAAIQGKVTQLNGSPIAGAIVRVVNVSNGRPWKTQTLASGAYLLEDVAVGGPYRIEALALGFAPEALSGIVLALGQRFVADLELRPIPVQLTSVEVIATTDPLLNSGRTGPAEIISRARIATLPNPGRDFLTLTVLSPQTMISASAGTANTGGITIGGQNRLYNSLLIDGGVNHDLYRGRLPGRETLPRPISLEALEEIQILAAPFDVRHGTFAGGLINAVTRSGTNARRGSVFGVLSDAAVVGQGVTGEAVADFRTWQYGGTLAGPIVRDRAHYFLSVDLQHQVVPDPGPLLTERSSPADIASIRVSHASAVRFQSILRDSFQLDPGTLGPVDGQVRSEDVFAKITMQLGTNSHLEASHHYTRGDRWGFISRTPGFYILSASSQRNPSSANASRLIWTSLLGHRWSNKLIASHLRLDDICRPSASFPVMRVGPAGAGQLVAGAEGGCPIQPINSVAQNALELTENLTGAFGDHAVTIGLHGEALHFRDDLLPNSSGIWTFATLDLLEARRAMGYQRTLPGPRHTGGPDFRAHHLGVYLQDRWVRSPRLSMTLGLRVDVPILPDAGETNESLKTALAIETGHLPFGRALVSPRLGINYEVGRERRTFLRGGIGVFSGRPPYMWLANAYRDNGMEELFLACAGTLAPPFEPASAPIACADGSGPVPRVSFFDPGARFPQNLKLALGVDHDLPGGIVGTVDLLYTRAVHQLYATDANLLGPIGVAHGEGNRQLYGAMSGSINSITRVPARHDPGFGQIVRLANSSGDHALSLSMQLRKRIADLVEATAFYSFTRARDRMSLVNPAARANLENTPLDGTLNGRPLRTSYFEIPHRLQVSTTVRLPYQASLSLLYAGMSGTPFTYVIEGDANADGIPSAQFTNDIVYVPRDSLDITLSNPAAWDSLDTFIAAEPCLRRQRGRILERNSCRNPWSGTLNARLTKAFPTAAGRSLEVMADVYNVPNLLNRRWGESRRTGLDPAVRMLGIVGYDASAERGVYRLALPMLRRTLDFESRWRAELGVRYVF